MLSKTTSFSRTPIIGTSIAAWGFSEGTDSSIASAISCYDSTASLISTSGCCSLARMTSFGGFSIARTERKQKSCGCARLGAEPMSRPLDSRICFYRISNSSSCGSSMICSFAFPQDIVLIMWFPAVTLTIDGYPISISGSSSRPAFYCIISSISASSFSRSLTSCESKTAFPLSSISPRSLRRILMRVSLNLRLGSLLRIILPFFSYWASLQK